MKQFLILLLLATFFSCGPVRRVINDPVKFNQVAQEVIRRGYCANDTTIVTNISDTVYLATEDYLDTLVFESGVCNFDTILPSGTKLRYQEGILTIREKIQYRTRVVTRKVDNYIKDKALEELLKKDIEAYKDTIIGLRSKVELYDKQLDKAQNTINKYKWYFYGLLGLIGVFSIYKAIKLIKPI
jgi:hypothetical protein